MTNTTATTTYRVSTDGYGRVTVEAATLLDAAHAAKAIIAEAAGVLTSRVRITSIQAAR